MKYLWAGALCLGLLACQGNTQDKTTLKSQKDSVSYIIGMDIGRNLKRQSVDIDPGVLAAGMRAVLDSSKPLLTDEQAQSTMRAYQQTMMAKRQEDLKIQGEKNKKEGDAFLAENKKKDSVVTLPSGLQYKILKQGSGKRPKATDTVTVNYRGTLIDGTEFDNSYKRGQPETFTLNGVISGWTEAIQLMPQGSKWMLYVPPELGYGSQGSGPAIPPNSVLIFEVELLAVK